MFCNSGKSSGPVRPPDGHTSSGLEAAVSGRIPSLPLGLDTLSYICLLLPLTLFPFFILFSVSSDKPFLFFIFCPPPFFFTSSASLASPPVPPFSLSSLATLPHRVFVSFVPPLLPSPSNFLIPPSLTLFLSLFVVSHT